MPKFPGVPASKPKWWDGLGTALDAYNHAAGDPSKMDKASRDTMMAYIDDTNNNSQLAQQIPGFNEMIGSLAWPAEDTHLGDFSYHARQAGF